jgi:hypothetical protein
MREIYCGAHPIAPDGDAAHITPVLGSRFSFLAGLRGTPCQHVAPCRTHPPAAFTPGTRPHRSLQSRWLRCRSTLHPCGGSCSRSRIADLVAHADQLRPSRRHAPSTPAPAFVRHGVQRDRSLRGPASPRSPKAARSPAVVAVSRSSCSTAAISTSTSRTPPSGCQYAPPRGEVMRTRRPPCGAGDVLVRERERIEGMTSSVASPPSPSPQPARPPACASRGRRNRVDPLHLVRAR